MRKNPETCSDLILYSYTQFLGITLSGTYLWDRESAAQGLRLRVPMCGIRVTLPPPFAPGDLSQSSDGFGGRPSGSLPSPARIYRKRHTMGKCFILYRVWFGWGFDMAVVVCRK